MYSGLQQRFTVDTLWEYLKDVVKKTKFQKPTNILRRVKC